MPEMFSCLRHPCSQQKTAGECEKVMLYSIFAYPSLRILPDVYFGLDFECLKNKDKLILTQLKPDLTHFLYLSIF